MQHYLGVPPTREKVLHLSVRSMAIITSYTIPPCTKAGLNTSVTQVWADSKYILALTETGLYVFEQYPSEQQHRIPIDDCAVIRLRSIIGPNEQQNPSFHAHNGRVLLTSANQSPIWCEI